MKRCRACPTLLPSQMSFPNWKQSNAAAKSQFETVTIVTFEEDSIDELSGDEQNLLETAFVDAYNAANAFNRHTCDL